MIRDIACATCAHRRTKMNVATPTCDAFPQGIPREIAIGDHLHLTPFEGDGGIRYAPSERAARLGVALDPETTVTPY